MENSTPGSSPSKTETLGLEFSLLTSNFTTLQPVESGIDFGNYNSEPELDVLQDARIFHDYYSTIISSHLSEHQYPGIR